MEKIKHNYSAEEITNGNARELEYLEVVAEFHRRVAQVTSHGPEKAVEKHRSVASC